MRQRAVSSVFIVGLTLGAAILGRLVFALFIAVFLGMALRETYALFRRAGHRPVRLVGYALLAALTAFALLRQWADWGAALITGAVLLPLLILVFRRDHQGALTDWALTVAGALYLALPAAHFVLLRDLDGALPSFVDRLDALGAWQLRDYGDTARGLGWFLLAQVVTWFTDTGAYLVGRRWGRRRLAPAISPGKTIEGALGGLAAGAVAAWLCAVVFALPLTALAAAAAGVLLSVVGQLGDLAESLLKRQVGAKDSGGLVRGHGGILDRIDGLLVVVIATYYLALLVD